MNRAFTEPFRMSERSSSSSSSVSYEVSARLPANDITFPLVGRWGAVAKWERAVRAVTCAYVSGKNTNWHLSSRLCQ